MKTSIAAKSLYAHLTNQIRFTIAWLPIMNAKNGAAFMPKKVVQAKIRINARF